MCCLSVISGKKSARQAAHFFPLLPGDESAVGTTGALGKRNIQLTKKADVSVHPQLNGGTVLSARATSKAEPSFESEYSSTPSTAPSQTGKIVVPESGKVCPDSPSNFLGPMGSRLQHEVVKGKLIYADSFGKHQGCLPSREYFHISKGAGGGGRGVCVWGGGLSSIPSSARILSMLIAPILH